KPGIVHRRVDEIDIKTALPCFGTGKTEHGTGAIDPANTVAEFRQQDGACPGAASEIDGISCLHSQSGGEDAPPLIPVAQMRGSGVEAVGAAIPVFRHRACRGRGSLHRLPPPLLSLTAPSPRTQPWPSGPRWTLRSTP